MNDKNEPADGLQLPARRQAMKQIGGAISAGAILAAGIAPQSVAAPGVTRNELTWRHAWEIAELVGSRRVSASEVTEHFLSRIEALEPQLHAFHTLDAAGARAQASEMDEALNRGQIPGPLQGVPVAVKEHIAVKGLPLFGPAGTSMIAEYDDILVERLRAAGAVIVGTTMMPGMGNTALSGGRDADLKSQPRNPWDVTRVPGSSSAGSAAAVAAAMLPLAIGSDGGGSTRLPAALCGVVGVHPAMGRVPMFNYQRPTLMLTTTVGPITRSVKDAALVMDVIAGPDGRDFIATSTLAPNYSEVIGKGAKGMRLAWTDNFGYGGMYATEQTEDVTAAVRAAAMNFNKLGADVRVTDEVWEDFWPSYVITSIALAEGAMAGAAEKPSAEVLKRALGVRQRNWQKFNTLFEQVDILLSATAQFTAYKIEDWDRAWNGDQSSYPHHQFAPTYTVNTHMFNWLGWPALSIPCGFVDGLPIGMQLVTRPGDEAKLYRAADAFLNAYPRPERPPVS